MKRNKSAKTLSIFFFCIAIMLSGSVFAEKIAATTIYEIGKTGPAGGIVFHISDGGGSRVRGHHGLEAAPVDQGTAPWGCSATEDIPGAEGEAIGTGAQNTIDILAFCTEPGIAAELAANYELNGYTDWFLPSKEELNLMYRNLYTRGLGGFPNTQRIYWSSSERGLNASYFTSLVDFYDDQATKSISSAQVRAVRAF